VEYLRRISIRHGSPDVTVTTAKADSFVSVEFSNKLKVQRP